MYTGRKGYLYDKLRNRLKSCNQNRLNVGEILSDTEANNNESIQFFNADGTVDSSMQYFKNCVVQLNRDELVQKLQETVDVRRNILKDNSGSIQKIFPFYFVDPNLVSYLSFAWCLYYVLLPLYKLSLFRRFCTISVCCLMVLNLIH